MYRYIICFDGPDAGKGWVILSNGNNRAALVNAEIAQRLILHARWYAPQRSEGVTRCALWHLRPLRTWPHGLS
jgi:hypothetical protein